MGGIAGSVESSTDVDPGLSLPMTNLSDLTRVAAKSIFALGDVFSAPMTGPKILIYHQVYPALDRQMTVAPELFERQLDWIAARGEIVRLEVAVPPGSLQGAEQYVLTFDDGYDGVYRYVFPLLVDRGIPFTLYLTSGLVDGEGAGAGLDTLTWAQVREMVASGLVTVGAHTHTHPDLRTIDSSQIADELDRSNEIITEQTGVVPRHFAYPKGYWAEAAEPLIRERYETATLGAGSPIGPDSDLHRLSRVPVQRSDGMFFFKWKIERGLRLEETARRRLKGYRNPSATGVAR